MFPVAPSRGTGGFNSIVLPQISLVMQRGNISADIGPIAWNSGNCEEWETRKISPFDAGKKKKY